MINKIDESNIKFSLKLLVRFPNSKTKYNIAAIARIKEYEFILVFKMSYKNKGFTEPKINFYKWDTKYSQKMWGGFIGERGNNPGDRISW